MIISLSEHNITYIISLSAHNITYIISLFRAVFSLLQEVINEYLITSWCNYRRNLKLMPKHSADIMSIKSWIYCCLKNEVETSIRKVDIKSIQTRR